MGGNAVELFRPAYQQFHTYLAKATWMDSLRADIAHIEENGSR